MKLFALTLFLLFPGDTCEECSPKKLCKPHVEAVKTGIVEVRAGLKSKQADQRISALKQAGELNRAHVNAPSKDVTKLIASSLDDDDLTVRAEAAAQLGEGQDPETAIKALSKAIPDVAQALGRYKNSHPQAHAAKAFARATVGSLASYKDDRSVEALSELLERHAAAIYGTPVYHVVDGLAELGARDGVEAMLGYYALMESLGSFPKLEAYLHDRLTDVATRHELEAPPWDPEGTSAAWKDWFDGHAKALPKKLGKAALPG